MHEQDPLILRMRAVRTTNFYGLIIQDALKEIERLRGIVPEVLERLNDELCAENERLRTALAKIADWDSNWGPFPENNEAWRAMVVVTAREAVPELGLNV